jgi:hypothetical protein
MARLTLPLRFRDEANANVCIEATGLFPCGARAVKGELGRWFVVIEVEPQRVEAKLRYMRTRTPGIEWRVSEGEGAP